MKYFIVAATLSAVSYAQVNIASATDCNSLTVQCLDLPDPNNPACNDSWDKCNLCHADYAACQMPGTDVSSTGDGNEIFFSPLGTWKLTDVETAK